MDDIYFSDNSKNNKNNKNHGGQSRPAPQEKSRDRFSGQPLFTEQGTKKRFVVNIPEDDISSEQRSRTPKGRPVSYPAQGRPTSSPNHIEGEVPEYIPTPTADFDASAYASPNRPSDESYARNRAMQQRSYYEEQHPHKAPPKKPQHAAPKKKKKKVVPAIIISIVSIFLVCLIGLFGYGYNALGKVTQDTDFVHKNQYIKESELMTSPTVKNILFLGSDARGEIQGQRSDTMILFSVDQKNHKIKMTSFLRDSYVYIPSKGYHTKLNHAFSYGGPQLLIDTIEYNFHVKIDDYVLIDFEGFKKLIDLMGGLTIEGVTKAEAKYMRDVVKVVYIKEGTNKMSGAASLWYCRIRYLDNDFHRTERQRKVVNALMKQALKTSPDKLMKIVDEVLPMITTSMDRNSLVKLGFNTVFNFIGGENEQHRIPADGTWVNARINGADVLKMDMDKNISLLKEFLY